MCKFYHFFNNGIEFDAAITHIDKHGVSVKLGAGAEVRLVFGQRDASFRIADVSVSTRLIEGDFPNYKGLIPNSHPNKVIVERDGFLEALRAECDRVGALLVFALSRSAPGCVRLSATWRSS